MNPSPSPPSQPQPGGIAERSRLVQGLVVDVDGVLTDGFVHVDDQGVETKTYSVRDGSGIHLWRRAGLRIGILSGRYAKNVEIRAKELGISPVVQGQPRKAQPFLDIAADWGLRPEQICYIGDDVADLPALRQAGLACCPADAVAEVRSSVHWVTPSLGGRGAVREVIELILKNQGRWEELIQSY